MKALAALMAVAALFGSVQLFHGGSGGRPHSPR